MKEEKKVKDVQNLDSVLGDCFFLVGSFVTLEGIVYSINSIDGSDNANGQSPNNAWHTTVVVCL